MGIFQKESYEDKCKRKEEERIKRAERDAEQRRRREQFKRDEEQAQLEAFMERYQLTDMNESDLERYINNINEFLDKIEL